MFLEIPLDTDLERDRTGGATDACSVEPDPDNSITRHFNQLQIAAIGLDCRANQIDDLGHTLVQGAVGEIGAGIIGHWVFLTRS